MILSRNSTEQSSLQIFNINTTWSQVSSSNLRLIISDKSANPEAVSAIQELVHKLAQLPDVTRVRAIATRFPDIHWIDFELELQPETELSDEVWDYVQDLVIDYAWKLWDDSGEEWYFRAQTTFEPSFLRDANEVIATEVGIKTWSSSPLKLIVH